MARIIFITGGSRSGKSSFALKETDKLMGLKAFIATLKPLDKEMRLRIKRHKAERHKKWDTYEEPINITPLIKGLTKSHKAVIIDCLTLWLSNIMHKGMDVDKEIKKLIGVLKAAKRLDIFLVSNEVGMGIVPPNEIARKFRDWQGILNQKIAGVSDEVYLMAAGIPIKIKGAASHCDIIGG